MPLAVIWWRVGGLDHAGGGGRDGTALGDVAGAFKPEVHDGLEGVAEGVVTIWDHESQEIDFGCFFVDPKVCFHSADKINTKSKPSLSVRW